jgi:hypothetical protein
MSNEQTSVKKVALVGFSIPNSNKNGGAEITLDDLKVVKEKIVKEKAEKSATSRPEFDLKWNATRGIIVTKKSYVEANPSDDYGYTFMFTNEKELLLIQGSSKNVNPAFRPKFLKGPKSTPSFKSEYGEFVIRLYLDSLNEGVEDGAYYLLSEDRHFNLVPVEVGEPDLKVFQVVEKTWLAKQPVVEAPAATDAPADAIDAEVITGEVAEAATEVEAVADAIDAEVIAGEVAEAATEVEAVATEVEVADALTEVDGVVLKDLGEDVPA